jgi:GNAT superfamily N-acetyltransferase
VIADIHHMTIEALTLPDPAALDQLASVLVACVDAGASVSFMHPLGIERAREFWRGVLDGAARGERIVLVARDAAGPVPGRSEAGPAPSGGRERSERGGKGRIVGTVQVITAQPENQQHRADVAKMLVHPDARRHGLGERLMRAAESAAQRAGKTLLVLDTASDVAARLYARCGWTEVGTIPDFASWPQGGLGATTVFYRRLPPT